MINNRQAGRRRGRGNNGNGNGQRPGNSGRPDNGNRIDSRARGNANQLYEKYKNLASDAQRQGDRVNTEYYLQFADHYFRVLSESRSRFEEQNQQRRQRDDFDADFDGDEEYGDEGEPIRSGEQSGDDQPRGDVRRERNQRDGGQRDASQRDGGQREEAGQRRRDEQPRRDDRNDRNRDEYGRSDRQRDDRQRDDRDGNRRVAAEVEDLPARPTEVANDLSDAPVAEQAAEPRRRGRPRRDRSAEAVAADADTVPAAMEADRLPPSLSPSLGQVANESDEGAEVKPRRRRLRTANGAESAAD